MYNVSDSDQLCTGVKASIKTAVHVMSEMFEFDESKGLLFIDAANVFNALKMPATLWNCSLQWPCCSLFLFLMVGFTVILRKGFYSRKLIVLLRREETKAAH